MKIAVAATTNNISADVSIYGGRAPFFLIFDEEGNLLDCWTNKFTEMESGAGYEVSQMMIEENVDILVGGVLGPTIIRELTNHGIRSVSTSGPAREAVLKLVL